MKENVISLTSIGAVLLGLFAAHFSPAVMAAAERDSAASLASDWREDYAYSMGIAAMNYAYPYYRMAHVRWVYVLSVQRKGRAPVKNYLLTTVGNTPWELAAWVRRVTS